MTLPITDSVPTVVIGGGQAGLAVGYHLTQRGLQYVILDAGERTGDPWRRRWDSLRLFTPARLDHLDGMALPLPGSTVPTKDDIADYLERYAQRFSLPIRHRSPVTRLTADSDGFQVTTDTQVIRAEHVVVAMSGLQVPRIPVLAAQLDPSVRSIHSSAYRNPGQLRDGEVLVVGAGNTGAEIAVEVAATHPTTLAGHESGHLPFRIDGSFGRHVGTRVVAFTFMHVLTTDTPLGRRARPRVLAQSDPLLRDRPRELTRAGVKRAGRITEVRDGCPVAEGGGHIDASNVIWCTGFSPGFDWIDLPVLDDDGLPRHSRGIVREQPGLYFVGLNFLYAKASETLPGVSRDARFVVEHLAQRGSTHRTATPSAAGTLR